MTREEAKWILLLYRPGKASHDPEMAQALELMRRDAELQRWFENHCAVQSALQQKFAEIAAPADLAQTISAGQRIVRPVFWRHRPAWLAAAAIIVLLGMLAAFWSRDMPTRGFALWRARMVSSTQREYPMELKTNNLAEVRKYLRTRGAPADFPVESKLQQLSVTGAGRLLWGTQSVAMVCFDRGDREMVFLFVIEKSGLDDAPGAQLRIEKVSGLQTASWSAGTNTFLVAGPDDPEFLRKYGPDQ